MVPQRPSGPRSSKRRYPRISNIDLEVSLRPRAQGTQSDVAGPAPATPPSNNPGSAEVCNLSPEGACLELRHSLDVRRGDWVTLRMTIDEAVVDLPSRVAWVSFDDGVQRVGIKLKLEVAPHAVRTRYARWIVHAIQSTRDDL